MLADRLLKKWRVWGTVGVGFSQDTSPTRSPLLDARQCRKCPRSPPHDVPCRNRSGLLSSTGWVFFHVRRSCEGFRLRLTKVKQMLVWYFTRQKFMLNVEHSLTTNQSNPCSFPNIHIHRHPCPRKHYQQQTN